MTQHSSIQPPPGISGKRVTVWVIVALVAVGASLSYTLWTYNRLDVARGQSALAWRDATESLAERYRLAEFGLVESSANGATGETFSQEFQSAVDTFRTTSIVNEQVAAAERIEELLGSDKFRNPAFQALPSPEKLQNTLDEYNMRRQREQVLLKSLGGRILDIFLEFPDSKPFRLANAK
ncbi:MAG: hypothetical protein ABI557_08690 [Aureliella sp.]